MSVPRIAALLVGGICFFVALAPGASAATITRSFAPSADSYVSSSLPTTNYGASSVVRESASGDIRRGYMRFVVSGLTGTVSGVSLRVRAETAHTSGFTVRRVTNTTWGETTITNSNAPTISSTIAGSSGAVTAGTYVTVPLTGIATANGTFSIGIRAAGSSTAVLDLASRETATPPLLQITRPTPSRRR